jgi:phosphate transport system substrate-binding protein
MNEISIEKIGWRIRAAFCAIALACGACGGASGAAEPVTLNVTGSTTVSPFIRTDATAFTARYPNVTINVTEVADSGSTAAIAAVGTGAVDIGMTSREAQAGELEQYPDLVQVGIALDAIDIAVHPSNPVSTLSLTQVRDIYSGKITNWSGVGGPDLTIHVNHRKAPSGTRDYFLEGVMKGVPVISSASLLSSSGMTAAIAADPSAIGYGKTDSVATLKPLSLQTDQGFIVAPNTLNIRTGAYPLNRPLFLITRGQAQGAANSFIEYALSDQGQQAVTAQGLVTIR